MDFFSLPSQLHTPDAIFVATAAVALVAVIALASAGEHASDYDGCEAGDHPNPIKIHTTHDHTAGWLRISIENNTESQHF